MFDIKSLNECLQQFLEGNVIDLGNLDQENDWYKHTEKQEIFKSTIKDMPNLSLPKIAVTKICAPGNTDRQVDATMEIPMVRNQLKNIKESDLDPLYKYLNMPEERFLNMSKHTKLGCLISICAWNIFTNPEYDFETNDYEYNLNFKGVL